MRRTALISSAVALALIVASGTAGARQHETADILGQEVAGNRMVVVEDGARLLRAPNNLSVRVGLSTPQPGTYNYPTMPPTGMNYSGPGHPEAFTLWAFIFNFPAQCDDGCDTGDIGGDAQGGAFFVTGHLVGGEQLVLSGQISTQSPTFVGSPLVNPAGAEVHLAIAPHGGLDASKMPAQIKTPTGPPAVWWIALFD